MPVSSIVPKILSGLPQRYAVFSRSVGSGPPDNFVPGQTVAEMFNWPTDFPIFGTILIPTNCHVYDRFGYSDATEIFDYTPVSGIHGALRLDDIHPDSMVLIANYGGIYGAGGPGGVGFLTMYRASGSYLNELWGGGGGGGGRGYLETRGGMNGYGISVGGDDWTWDAWVLNYLGIHLTVLPTDGEDWSEGAGGGTGQYTSGASGSQYYLISYSSYYDQDNNQFPIIPHNPISEELAALPTWAGWAHHKVLPVHPDNIAQGYPSVTPGYAQANKSVFNAQPGTAAIVCGCKTWIYNSTVEIAEIFGGGGGGVGGDRAAQVNGASGGDWGEAGFGSNYQAFVGGAAGKSIAYNGVDPADVIFIEGDNPIQVKGPKG